MGARQRRRDIGFVDCSIINSPHRQATVVPTVVGYEVFWAVSHEGPTSGEPAQSTATHFLAQFPAREYSPPPCRFSFPCRTNSSQTAAGN